MKQIRNSLGIVFYEQAIAVAEVESGGGQCRVRRSAEFKMPDGVTIETLASQQANFAAFLKDNGFKSRNAVVGVSARQMISTRLKIPPIEDEQTRFETIRIQLERKLELEFSDIVFDCWGQAAAGADTLVLMTLKRHVTAIKAFLASFKITPLFMSASSLALDLTIAGGVDCHLINYPNSVEVFVFQDQSLQSVLNISKATPNTFEDDLAGDIARQINRLLWSLPSKSEQPRYTVWTSQTDTSVVRGQLESRLPGLQMRPIKNSDGSASENLCDVAAQLAQKVVTGDPVRINFLNVHHHTKTSIIPKQWYRRIAIAVAAVIVLLGVYFYDWYADCCEIEQYDQSLLSMKENVQDAEQMIQRVGHARQWFARQPVHLENLRELTLAFPRSSDIWLTSLAVDASQNQVIAGRANSEDAILDVVDKLKANERFKDIKLMYIRKMGKSTDVMTFAINFSCQGGQ